MNEAVRQPGVLQVRISIGGVGEGDSGFKSSTAGATGLGSAAAAVAGAFFFSDEGRLRIPFRGCFVLCAIVRGSDCPLIAEYLGMDLVEWGCENLKFLSETKCAVKRLESNHTGVHDHPLDHLYEGVSAIIHSNTIPIDQIRIIESHENAKK